MQDKDLQQHVEDAVTSLQNISNTYMDHAGQAREYLQSISNLSYLIDTGKWGYIIELKRLLTEIDQWINRVFLSL